MTAVRRHLASLGLMVVLGHLSAQVLVSAALCCQKPSAGARVEAPDCCPAGAHPGRTCPLHASSRAKEQSQERDCKAQPLADLHDLLFALMTGGPLPADIPLSAPAGSEATPADAQLPLPVAAPPPPGHPPRV
jgi:hypothetical protein